MTTDSTTRLQRLLDSGRVRLGCGGCYWASLPDGAEMLLGYAGEEHQIERWLARQDWAQEEDHA